MSDDAIDPEPLSKSWGELKENLDLPRMSDDDLRKFVDDFLSSRIFTDKHIALRDRDRFLSMIFLPVAFGGLAEYRPESLQVIGCIWEYMLVAGPSLINGYPIFMSLRLMHKVDWERARVVILREEERRKAIEL